MSLKVASPGMIRGIVIGVASGWLCVGLYIAPIATLVWLTGVSALTATAWYFATWLDTKLYDRLENGQCAHCGYYLRGSGDRGECPECGAWFGPGWGGVPKPKPADPAETDVAAKSAEPAVATQPPAAAAAAAAVTSSPQTSTAPAAERKSA